MKRWRGNEREGSTKSAKGKHASENRKKGQLEAAVT